ncbi:ABC transporter substrate-binding protein [Cohnella sp.]|uniref:ABC transporter substrate-binding protein n=1 Tax=Cohnella sp. TaxID=1883426 RepID=UPI00356157B4
MQRNKIAVVIGMLFMMILLAACGSNSGTEGNDVNAESNTNGGENVVSSEPATRTITHLRGESTVPVNIERAVVLSAAYIDHLLTIGEKPYAVNVELRYGGDYPAYLADQLEGVHLVGSADSPNLEAITELDPDVIVIESRTADEVYTQLEKIAPTIVLGTEWLDYEDDTTYWTKDLLKIAELYGKEDAAKQKIAELEAKTAQAKLKIDALEDKRLAYLRVRDKTVQIYAQTGHPINSFLYHDLGFVPTALTPESQREDISLEVIPQLDANYLVLEVDPNGQENLKTIKESSLWKPVPAVQKEQVFETDSYWLFKGWGVIGRGQIIDDLMSWLD